LIQNVLSYPNMPPKICRRLPNIAADMDSMTALVEQMASYFGKELTLIYINNTPDILGLDFNTVLQRIKGFTQLLGVLDSDVPMMLRKYSGLVALEPQELKLRYDNLRELTQFDNQQVREGWGRGALMSCCPALAVQLVGPCQMPVSGQPELLHPFHPCPGLYNVTSLR
jgi:hypothetical protein